MTDEQQYHFWFSAKEKELMRSKAIESGEDFSLGLFRRSEFTTARIEKIKPNHFDDYQYLGAGALSDIEDK